MSYMKIYIFTLLNKIKDKILKIRFNYLGNYYKQVNKYQFFYTLAPIC